MQVLCDEIRYRGNKYKKRDINVEDDTKKAFLSVIPTRLEFSFDSGNFKVQEGIIEITNYFSKPCPVLLLPLETQYFRIGNVSQRKWLNPGSVFKISILFVPDENRDYNDVLKIRYFNNQLIEIVIFAKIMTIFSFPTIVNFGNVPLDQPVCYKIPIHSHAKKEFSFAVLPSKENSCVDIYPRWGRMKPGREPLIIMIIYRPLQYISMHFQIRIFISDLCKTPHVINFYAYTRPGLLRETIEKVKPEMKSKKERRRIGALPCREIKPISRKEGTLKPHMKEPITKHPNFRKTLLQKCSHFPLYSLHATNCILNSKIRRSFDEYELNGPLGAYLSEIMEQKAQKRKEFLMMVENRRHENEQTKLHHKPKVNYGNDDANENQIKIRRELLWDEYRQIISNPQNELFERHKATKFRQRILRASHQYPDAIWTSGPEEISFLRYARITPFLQAARKIVLRNRLLKSLEKLQNLIHKSIL